MSKLIGTIGKRIVLSKIDTARASAIYLPETTMQKTLLGVIRYTGRDVKDAALQKDAVVLVDTTSVKKYVTRRRNGNAEITSVNFICEEKDVLLIRRNKIYYPLGNTVLIQRINDEIQKGQIVIPSCYQSSDQSLFGVVTLKGLKDTVSIEYPVAAGDIVKIEKWDHSIREVEIDDKYYLIVPTRLLQYVCDKETMINNFVK
jgi:co-chaperonin GroES (HSP10)